MRRHKQQFMNKPELGQYGDCHRTVMACLLDIEVDQSPHFIGEFERRKAQDVRDEYSWADEQEKWLNSLGYTTVDVAFQGEIKSLFDWMSVRNPGRLYVLGGQSPRGTNHSVVCCGGEFHHDPHPDGGFLVGPMDYGFWEVTFVLPLSMKVAA